MPGLFPEQKLVLASHNAGKRREFEKLLALPGISLLDAAALSLPEPAETGTSFSENARIKARAACRAARLPALADDSGLCVAALDGAPGIHSARWAGPEKNFAGAMEKIRRLLAGKNRMPARAAFVAALCLAFPDDKMIAVEGRVEGSLVFPPRGANGFGYDPLFVPDGHGRTFGEMTAEEKAALSHRARALALLRKELEKAESEE